MNGGDGCWPSQQVDRAVVWFAHWKKQTKKKIKAHTNPPTRDNLPFFARKSLLGLWPYDLNQDFETH